ncbi:MAG: tRNA (N(6)-L-threonylcarbamoyladenosine(37)-C(2))-methylthiotransferase MtaB, partial [Firmicutes bacterium HGW-Firmicutes-13]
MNKTAAFYTLGCKVNQYETEALANLFRQGGYEVVDFSDKADVYVINTCTVTHLSDRKSRQMIRRAKKNNPEGIVAVMGCYAQIKWKDIRKIPGVDLILGTQDRLKVVELVEKIKTGKLDGVDKEINGDNKEYREAGELDKKTKQVERKTAVTRGKPVVVVKELGNAHFEEMPLGEIQRTRAFIKIEDGCEHFCTYCLVPHARGPVRSRDIENILADADRMAYHGAKEIVLTGVNLGAYGKDLEGDVSLAEVILKMQEISEIKRIRLSSLEPTDFTMELIETIEKSDKVCRHLHIPLQSGDDYILKKMNRRYEVDEYRKLVCYLRYLMPDLALTTDVMVGFPGEKEVNFNNTYEFVKEMAFSRLHVFKYSPRPGTPAGQFPDQVSPEDKDYRSRKLSELGSELSRQYSKRFVGRKVEVLFEEEK